MKQVPSVPVVEQQRYAVFIFLANSIMVAVRLLSLAAAGVILLLLQLARSTKAEPVLRGDQVTDSTGTTADGIETFESNSRSSGQMLAQGEASTSYLGRSLQQQQQPSGNVEANICTPFVGPTPSDDDCFIDLRYLVGFNPNPKTDFQR